MSEAEVNVDALKVEITITDNKIAYSHNMPPQSALFWLEAVKKIILEDTLNGRKEDASE